MGFIVERKLHDLQQNILHSSTGKVKKLSTEHFRVQTHIIEIRLVLQVFFFLTGSGGQDSTAVKILQV